MKEAVAFAPATVANVAVGFDILGFALEGLGERATVRHASTPVVTVDPVDGYPELPTDPVRNTATAGLVRLIADKKLRHGFHVTLEKTIPIGSGLGGSSTSAVAAITAANALLDKKLKPAEILEYALLGEEVASGSRHGDNIAPCIEGGLVFVRSAPRLETTRVKTPASFRCVVLLPRLSIKTKEARGILKPEVPLKAMIEQTANLGGFLLGCAQNDLDLVGRSLRDVVIEPQRAALIPGFYDLQGAALAAGALGCSISGSGPAIFALTAGDRAADRVRKALLTTSARLGLPVHGTWCSKISRRGARLLGGQK